MGNAVKKNEYNAQSIEVLEGLEAVRKRPGMYIAGTDTIEGLHQLFTEVLDNSIDEAMNGYASLITVTLRKDARTIAVEDNGRGIPVDIHPKFKQSALELILTTLHAGGKFSDKNYTASGGLHGVGSSVVNALSDNLEATIYRDGGEYFQAYKHGVPYAPVKKIKSGVKKTGTKIEFTPDYSLFKIKKFSPEYMKEKIKIKAFLNAGLLIKFIDESSETEEDFCYSNGLQEFLKETLETSGFTQVGDSFNLTVSDPIPVTLAMSWTEDTKEVFLSYVNGIYTPDGGTHEQGAKNGVVKAIRNYLQTHGGVPKGLKIGAEDIREGLVCVLSIQMPAGTHQPQFQGQTKSKLNNPEITPIVENALKSLELELNQKPSVAEKVMERIFLAARARQASRSAVQQVRRKVGLNQRMTLPGKLADCSSNNLADTELFLVEGDSAGGSTKQGRDRHYQAVLALRGKVLNTIASNDKKILENKELGNIVAALGCGIGKDFNIKKLRYGKVVILTDADADGMHIGTLLLAFFYTQMKPLIDEGRLYLGKPPLFGVFSAGAKKNDAHWAYSDSELQKVLKTVKGKPRVVRYKGLGEMNADTLWDTTLDPKKRTLLRISAGEMKCVLAEFESLMGSDSSARYKLIQDNADRIEIDV
jgi:DNA gyrase/topoisomerase IV subunit B